MHQPTRLDVLHHIQPSLVSDAMTGQGPAPSHFAIVATVVTIDLHFPHLGIAHETPVVVGAAVAQIDQRLVPGQLLR
ncbi:hypothetical protein D9M70_640960 [compost metagenome]